MSKNYNYAKMYNKNDSAVVNDILADPIRAEETTPVVPEDTANSVKVTFGIVTGCEKLNVREKPDKNAEVLYVVEVNTELNIDLEKSTHDWFSVSNAAGIEGYCMKAFVVEKK